MKKNIKRFFIISLMIIPIVLVSFLGIIIRRKINTTKNSFNFLNNQSDKVILFIGDGMGENHLKVASSYLNKDLFINSFKDQGYVTTYSNSIFSPTDSAAAATSLATGKKVNNKEVSKHHNKNLFTISEYVKSLNKGVGIITTDSLSGATPACFSSHAQNRNDEDDIISNQAISNIDLFLGAGKASYDKYKNTFIEKGYTYIESYANLNVSSNKIIASFEKISNYTSYDLAPTLENLVEFAINYMEFNYPNGYFLMIEGAHIDKESHKNNIYSMIEYLDEFDNSIKLASSMTSNVDNCSIIVTADHETGNLKYTGTEKIDNSLYTRKSHSSKNVKYFINFKLKDNISYSLPNKIDNTDIYKICKALLTNNN